MYGSENRKGSNRREDGLQSGRRMPVLCIVERESNLGKLAVDHLELEGFGVRTLLMGTSVIQQVEHLHPAVVIIEATIARARALELCRGIRRVQSLSRTALILLAPNASEEERVLGLESGADDYITQSSSWREVVARVRAVMRRFARHDLHSWMPHILPPYSHASIGTPTSKIKMGDLEIDPIAMIISVHGNPIVITNLEFRLLYYLAHNRARVFSREQLLDAVWGSQNNVELRSVDACVRRLRRKIEPDPLRPTYLKTVRGAGYFLQVASA
jgi:two-component system, OmpR family, phosphate regulon response regulator PhoB